MVNQRGLLPPYYETRGGISVAREAVSKTEGRRFESYEWKFVRAAGKAFTDSGTTNCH